MPHDGAARLYVTGYSRTRLNVAAGLDLMIRGLTWRLDRTARYAAALPFLTRHHMAAGPDPIRTPPGGRIGHHETKLYCAARLHSAITRRTDVTRLRGGTRLHRIYATSRLDSTHCG